jgi:hypothetical protein
MVNLVEEVRGVGRHVAFRDGRDASGVHVADGVYFVRLTAGGEVATRKLISAR